MKGISVKDISKENFEDLCRVCIPPKYRKNPDFIKGIEAKNTWSQEMLEKWGTFGKIGYLKGERAGIIQYEPLPDEKVISIICIFVPQKDHWQKGIASHLLANLTEDMREPKWYFDDEYPLALVTKTFPGEGKDQLSAREFFRMRGFKLIGEDPDYLYYPLEEHYLYKPKGIKEKVYIPHEEDKGRVLIINGPNNCPFTYPYFLKYMEKYIREIDEEIPIEWIDIREKPEEVKKRNLEVTHCIVNGVRIKSFVVDKIAFQDEVREALAVRS
jgi:N-acetylglutamate synthase-like GNAT family acetyltransferase